MDAKFSPLLIGSLPLLAAEKAIEAVFAYTPKSPSWPQLPKISPFESMNMQYLEGIPGWHIEKDKVLFKKSDEITEEFTVAFEKTLLNDTASFPITSSHSVCFEPFLHTLAKRENIELIKGQVIGPVTFLTSHSIDEYGMLIKDEGYKELIPRILGLKAKYQIERFRQVKPSSDYIIFFDEPILSQIGSAVTSINTDDIKELITNSASFVDGYKGIHICGNSDWDFILSLPIDIVNFDAFNYGESFLLYKEAIKSFVKRGGYIAAGLIPTDSNDVQKNDINSLAERSMGFLRGLKGIIGRELLFKRIFITPSCGMGALTIEEAEKSLNLLSYISNTVKENSFS